VLFSKGAVLKGRRVQSHQVIRLASWNIQSESIDEAGVDADIETGVPVDG
jgi:hypothetical protein